MQSSPITLEALTVLHAIDQRGSYAAAAEHLNKVPSALSYIVQKLEEQLGISLFVREGRRSVLTPAGRYVLEEGRKILGAVNRVGEQAQTIAHGWEPKLRIGYDTIIDIQTLYPAIAHFLEEHPSIEIDLSEHVMNGSWESIIKDKVDIIIGAPGPVPNHAGLRAIEIDTIDQLLVAPPNHPLTSYQQSVTKEDIANYRTVVVHDSVEQAVARSSNLVEQSHHFYVTTIEQKIQAIKAGIGVGFLPRKRIQTAIEQGTLCPIPTAEATPQTTLFMAWKVINKGKGLKTFIEKFQLNNKH